MSVLAGAHLRAASLTDSKSELLLHFIEARAVFPLMGGLTRRQIDVRAVGFDSVGPGLALAWLRQALRDDPNGAVLLFHGVVQLLRDGDVVQAGEWVRRLEDVAPEWIITAYAGQLVEEAGQ